MSNDAKAVEKQAQEYYDSSDADTFYHTIWGGEDIHVGMYKSEDESIFDASRRTVERMTDMVRHLPSGTRAVDVGAGYGGSARYLAKELGFHVTCLNLSLVQNRRNREKNEEQGLADKVDVVDGTFEDLPFEDNSFELAWSQDAFLHSGERKKVFEEMDRVLKPGGEVIFTDPMQKENVDPAVLQPVLDRIHLDTMGTIETYRKFAKELGWEEVAVEEMSDGIINHYSHVLKGLEAHEQEVKDKISEDYVTRMKAGLNHWINAGKQNALTWGILHFRKARG